MCIPQQWQDYADPRVTLGRTLTKNADQMHVVRFRGIIEFLAPSY